MREIVHIQAGQCGNQIGSKVSSIRHRDARSPVLFDEYAAVAITYTHCTSLFYTKHKRQMVHIYWLVGFFLNMFYKV